MRVRDDRDYYLERASQEREMAEKAADPAVAALHATLAAEYRRRAQAGSATVEATPQNLVTPD